MKKFAIILSLLLALTMVLAACGDADDEATDENKDGTDKTAEAGVSPDGSNQGSTQGSAAEGSDKDSKSKEPAKTDVYGTWKCTAVDLTGEGKMMSAKDFKKAYDGADLAEMYVLEFDKNGNALLTTTIGDESSVGDFTYTEANGVYTLIEKGIEDVDGYDQAVTAEIHGKTLTLIIAGRVTSDDGQQISVKLSWEFEKTSK